MAAAKKREVDPATQVRQLAASVEGAQQLARGYCVRGAERYFRDRAIAAVRERAAARDAEVVVHDAVDPDFSLQDALSDLQSASMFASERCVIVRGADALLKTHGKEQSPLTRAIVAFVEAKSPPGTVVLEAEGLRADHAAAKAIAKAGGAVVACRKLWEGPPPWDPDPRKAELVQWLVARARELGVRLPPAHAAYVAAATGNDLYALEGQLEKLRRSGGRALTEIVDWGAGASPFAVADDLCGGDLARALAGVEGLFRGGFQGASGGRVVDPTALANILVASLVRQVRQSLAVASALERSAPESDALAAAAWKGSPQQRNTVLERARAHRPAAWRAMLDELGDLERRAKSGSVPDASDFAAFAARWCRARRRVESRR